MRKSQNIYNHYLCEERNTILIGVPKEYTEEEVSLLVDTGLEIVNPKILELDVRDRIAFFKALERNKEMRKNMSKKKVKFVGAYWEALADFIYCSFGMSLYDLAAELLSVSLKLGIHMDESDVDEVREMKKMYYDMLDKMRDNKQQIGDLGANIVKLICFKFGITEDIVRTGRGVMYVVDPQKQPKILELLDVWEYCEKCESDGKIENIKEMMMEKMGLQDADIEKISLQIVGQRNEADKKNAEFVDILLDELIKSRK